MNFKTFPELRTERLILRELVDSDQSAIFSLRSDERVNKYLDRPKPKSIDEAKAFITKIKTGIKNHNNFYWAICMKHNPDLIGTICLWNFSEDNTTAEIGYELNPLFQNLGYMNEAIAFVLKYSFNTIGLKKIEAYTHKDNIKSTQILKKNKFSLDKDRKNEENNNLIFILTGYKQ